MYFEKGIHESANLRYSVNPVRICFSINFSSNRPHMIASKLFLIIYLFIFIFIYSSKILAEFTSCVGF